MGQRGLLIIISERGSLELKHYRYIMATYTLAYGRVEQVHLSINMTGRHGHYLKLLAEPKSLLDQWRFIIITYTSDWDLMLVTVIYGHLMVLHGHLLMISVPL